MFGKKLIKSISDFEAFVKVCKEQRLSSVSIDGITFELEKQPESETPFQARLQALESRFETVQKAADETMKLVSSANLVKGLLPQRGT